MARLDEITGIGRDGAQAIIAEIGPDMTRFPQGRLVSWAKCPRAPSSPGWDPSGTTGEGNSYLKGMLGEAKAAAARTEYLPRIVKRQGKLKALVIVVRTILVIIWHCSPTAPHNTRTSAPAIALGSAATLAPAA